MSAAAFPGLSPTRAAWQSFATRKRWWEWALWALVLVGVPLVPSAIGAFKGEFRHGAFVSLLFFGAFALVVLAGLWGLQVTTLMNQNHPTLARLVPGQPRRLRINLVLSFLVLSSAAGLIAQSMLQSGAGAILIATFVYIAISLRWPLAWATTGILGFGPLLQQRLPPAARDLLAEAGRALATPLGMACLLTAGAVFLAGFIGDGDSLHHARYDRLQRRRRAVKASMAGEAMQSGWLGRLLSRGYQRDFERVLSNAQAGRPGFKREMLALGPQAHITATMQGLIVFTGILAFVLIVFRLTGVFDLDKGAGQGFANSLFGLVGVLIGGVTQLRACLVRRRHEQALVSLLPGVPRGRAFNRQLALALLGQYFALWALGSVLTSLVLLLFSGTQYAVIAFSTTLLGGGLVLLRDWTNGALIKGWLAFLIYLPLMGVAFAARLAMERGALSVGTFLAAAVIVLVPLFAWRWHAALRAPMAWPVGRRG